MWRRPCSPSTRSTSRTGGTPIPLAAMASVETAARQARRKRRDATDILDVLPCAAATLRHRALLAKRGRRTLVTARPGTPLPEEASAKGEIRRRFAAAFCAGSRIAFHCARSVPGFRESAVEGLGAALSTAFP